jgi:hypothetical protein
MPSTPAWQEIPVEETGSGWRENWRNLPHDPSVGTCRATPTVMTSKSLQAAESTALSAAFPFGDLQSALGGAFTGAERCFPSGALFGIPRISMKDDFAGIISIAKDPLHRPDPATTACWLSGRLLLFPCSGKSQ